MSRLALSKLNNPLQTNEYFNERIIMKLIQYQRPELAWPGFGRLSSLRDELDRLFESPWTELARTSQLLSGWTPALDVYEDKENFIVKAELPGMKKEDIDVSLHDDSLSISGERKSETKAEDAEVCRAGTLLWPIPTHRDIAGAGGGGQSQSPVQGWHPDDHASQNRGSQT